MKLIYNIPNFSLRKIVTGYEILDPTSETGSREIKSEDLAEGDIIVAVSLNSACLKKLIDAYGEKAIMVHGDDEKAEAAPFVAEKLLPADIIALLSQEPPTRYAAHRREAIASNS